ncbi:polysaccharide biosynthesis C-terminal domain-containing protein [Streptomyces sp. BK340]|uniref:polysaccharide biosynthesis C-terminal domain-containing protein n=1 Tax=Streptomyces sp. BK340 TaxID=2572903 RepID=UPI0011A89498|nr:polysaccharide biosynthesis C-terminal domain-containing protein [Streptomyces sp. BK340]TVZ88963.1 O-antigen/teichoic acid export membrane protein [Streptomyces sp. BK340]
MSDTTTTTEAATPEDQAPEQSGRRLRLPGTGRGSGGSQLFRNAYALMLNTGISAVLGLGFWLAAARYYSESAVGQGSAAIAAMKLLAGLTAVTLTGALARFIPVSGQRTGRLIFRTYAGSSLVVAVAAGIFLLTLNAWGPSYRFLHGPLNGLGFVLAVVAWNLLTLQDGVLTGLRSAPWVPVGNTVFSAVKLGLLVAFAVAIPTTGVFVSWVAAIATSAVPLGWLVFRRLVPRHVRATEDHARPPSMKEIGRFLAGDYTGSLFSLAVVYLVPVIIASQVSSADNAYFYITTTIGGTTNLLAINMGASLTVEGSHDPGRLAADTRAALRRMARIMLPIATVLFVGAPWILGVFGTGYADAATPLLRWFAVGAVLRVVMETYFAVLRAQSRTGGLAWLQGLLCVLVLALTLLLLPRMGLTGAGVAEISSLAVIVAIAAPKLWRTIRSTPSARSDTAAPDGDLADLGALPHPRLRSGRGTPTAPAVASAPRHRPAWALDNDTLALGIHVDFDHVERRPDVRPGPGTPPAGTPVPRPVEEPEPGAEASLGPAEAALLREAEADAPFEKGLLKEAEADTPFDAVPSENAVVDEVAAESPDTAVDGAVDGKPSAPPAPSGLTRSGVVLGCLLVAALLLYWVPALRLGEADLDGMGGLGLVSVLPLPTLVGAALLITVFASLLWLRREHRALLLVTLLATVVSLHALPAVLETEPRFATAWQHLGFIDYIDRTGSAVPDLDARWSWPGFFAVAAFVARACGTDDFTEIIRWWPTAVQLAYLAPMFLLTRSLRASWRAKWTGVWLFVLSGWVGQDYFSPQGFTFLLYLVFVAILLVWFRAPHMVWTKFRPGEAEVEPTDRRGRAVLLMVLIGLYAASVPAHQLTPFVMLGVLAALVLLGRSELRGLPVLFAVLVAVWVGFMAEPYWSGHFDDLFGGVGGVGSNVSSSVSGRIQGGNPTHKLVLYTRVLLAGSVLALACWGWWRRRFHRYRERSLPVLTFVPFLGFGMQSYGGEMALRVFMFAAPGAALLGALALFPRTGATATEREKGRGSLAPLAALLAGLLLMGGFLVARWGNESFERTRPGEVAAMDWVYAHDRPTVRLLWLSQDTVNDVTPAMPWGARDMERVNYVPTQAPVDPVLVSGLVKALKDAGPNSYLMINESQATYLQLDAGYSATWKSRLIRTLDNRQELTKVLVNDDVTVYALGRQPAGPVPKPNPGRIGPQVTWTSWSVVGALAAVALILLLTAREVVRVAARPSTGQLRWLQGSFWFSLPLLAVVLASLVQRFLTMK